MDQIFESFGITIEAYCFRFVKIANSLFSYGRRCVSLGSTLMVLQIPLKWSFIYTLMVLHVPLLWSFRFYYHSSFD